jgi:hypothetical protein
MRLGRYTLTAAAVSLAIAGCGGASNVKIPGRTPSRGYTTYSSMGFSVSIPAGWIHAPASSTPDGRTVISYATHDLSAEVSIEYFAHPREQNLSLTDLRSSLEQLNRYLGPALKPGAFTLSKAKVPGAAQARLVTIHGHAASKTGGEKDLWVQMRSGPIVEVSASRRTANASFDPSPVIDSFRVTGS